MMEWRCVWKGDEPQAQAEPGVRSSHGITADAGNVYLFGGERVARVPVDNSVYRLNLKGDEKQPVQWEVVAVDPAAPAPPHRIAHAQVRAHNGFIVFGGRQGIVMHESPLNDMWHFDTRNSRWREIKHVGEPPCQRSFHRMVTTAQDGPLSTLYVFAGCGAEGRLADLHAADIDLVAGTATWRRCSAPPPECRGRGGPGFVYMAEPAPAGSLVVVAGFAGEETDDMYVFDIASGMWTTAGLTGAPFTKRSVFAMAAIGSVKAVVFGGEVSQSDRGHEGAGDFEGDTLVVDSKGVVASASDPSDGNASPPARGWAACDVDGSVFVLSGGLAGNDESPVRLADVWVGTM